MTTQINQSFSNIDFLNDITVCKLIKSKKKFINELEFLQELQHLDTVVKLIDYDEPKKKIYLEYLPYSLDTMIKSYKLNYNHKINILKQVCNYIIESHELGIVHNDLKSKNILLTEEYEVKIIDYDLASWDSNPQRDIKQFKFLAIQMLFDIDYTQSYKKYNSYIKKVPEEFYNIFILNDIYKINSILDNIM